MYEPLGTRGQWPSPSAPGGRELVTHPSRRVVVGLHFVPGEATKALPFSPGGWRCVDSELKDLPRSTVYPIPPWAPQSQNLFL